MNVYDLSGFDGDKGLEEWELVFKELKDYVEDKEGQKCRIMVGNEGEEQEERKNRKGEWFRG